MLTPTDLCRKPTVISNHVKRQHSHIAGMALQEQRGSVPRRADNPSIQTQRAQAIHQWAQAPTH